jgi:hypothetical protein
LLGNRHVDCASRPHQEVAMKNREHDGDQPGAQTHAEGEYGERARGANRERIHHAERDERDERDANDANDVSGDESESSTASNDGRHRLREDRQQHDEADKNSEKNRARNR